MSIPIEDGFADIISKAQVGLELSDGQLAEASGLSAEAISRLKAGQPERSALLAVAPVLNLDGVKLTALADGKLAPEVAIPEGLLCYNTPFPVPGDEEMTVNAYMVYDPPTRQAIAFDTGADASGMLEDIAKEKLALQLILLTHTHADHIQDLLILKEKTGAPARVSEKEKVAGARPFEAGESFQCGQLKIQSIETTGHSPGGTTYFIEGLSVPLAIVGDALFAGSVGGAARHWKKALEQVRTGIFSLPDTTILCPGHGPLTTVALEKAHNPVVPG